MTTCIRSSYFTGSPACGRSASDQLHRQACISTSSHYANSNLGPERVAVRGQLRIEVACTITPSGKPSRSGRCRFRAYTNLHTRPLALHAYVSIFSITTDHSPSGPEGQSTLPAAPYTGSRISFSAGGITPYRADVSQVFHAELEKGAMLDVLVTGRGRCQVSQAL